MSNKVDKLLNEAAKKHMKDWNLPGFKRKYARLYKTIVEAVEANGPKERVPIALGLNVYCAALLPRVEKVFLFDDDATSLLLHEILEKSPTRATGMKTYGENNNQCSQISFYEMPNSKVCAIAYPSSVKVDYNEFKEEIHKVFKHVKDQNFSGEPYAFQLYCEKNGYKKKDG